MPRRGNVPKREVLPDPIYGSALVTKLINSVMPGDNVEMDVELITPIAIEKGLRFAIREGGRTVGSGAVIEINA